MSTQQVEPVDKKIDELIAKHRKAIDILIELKCSIATRSGNKLDMFPSMTYVDIIKYIKTQKEKL